MWLRAQVQALLRSTLTPQRQCRVPSALTNGVFPGRCISAPGVSGGVSPPSTRGCTTRSSSTRQSGSKAEDNAIACGAVRVRAARPATARVWPCSWRETRPARQRSRSRSGPDPRYPRIRSGAGPEATRVAGPTARGQGRDQTMRGVWSLDCAASQVRPWAVSTVEKVSTNFGHDPESRTFAPIQCKPDSMARISAQRQQGCPVFPSIKMSGWGSVSGRA